MVRKTTPKATTTLLVLLFLILPFLFPALGFTGEDHAVMGENFPGPKQVRIIKPAEIDALTPQSAAELKERFGQPLMLEAPAFIWPRQRQDIDISKASDLIKVAYGYWFFFDSNKYIKETAKLKYVVSLKGQAKEPQLPLLDLLPEMTVDWPKSLQGVKVKSLMEK